jgi:hypothetical protein
MRSNGVSVGVVLIAGSLALALLAVFAWRGYLRPSPEEALFLFGIDQVAEDQITCPLIRAGTRACPTIVREVADPSAPQRRRYAIGALGNLRCIDAEPLLLSIFYDGEELVHFRADALASLWLVNPDVASPLADAVVAREGYLGFAARQLLSGRRPFTLTYWEAVLCPHR